MAMLTHLGAILFGWIVPLVIYLIKKDESPYLRKQAAEALNFQITMVIGMLISLVLCFVLIGFLLIPVLWILNLTFSIIAAMAVNRGENYAYPSWCRFPMVS